MDRKKGGGGKRNEEREEEVQRGDGERTRAESKSVERPRGGKLLLF